MSESIDTEQETGITTAEGMVQSLIPFYIEGDKKAQFLSYILASFSKAEAVKLADIHPKTLSRWMQEPDFIEFMAKVPELKKELSNELLDIEFTRNFRLVLRKDFKILFKDATDADHMTASEQDYLKILRKFYTPQHLVMLRQLFSGNGNREEAFDFTKTVLEIRLSKEERHG